MDDFDWKAAPLTGTRLIEASAGTGKTHNLVALVLRALLFEDQTPEQIAVVTFTRKATGELRQRIAAALESTADLPTSAERAAGAPRDELLDQLVAAADVRGVAPAELGQRAEQALAQFEMLRIETIHGCFLQILKAAGFSALLREPVLDQDAAVRAATLACRRLYARSTLDPADPATARLVKQWPTADAFADTVRAAMTLPDSVMAGTLQALPDGGARGALSALTENQSIAVAELEQEFAQSRESGIVDDLLATVAADINAGSLNKKRTTPVLRALLAFFTDQAGAMWRVAASGDKYFPDCNEEGLIGRTNNGKQPGCLDGRFSEILKLPNRVLDIATVIHAETPMRLLRAGVGAAREAEAQLVRESGRMGHNGVIRETHAAIHGAAGDALVADLRGRLKTVLVDEFQDTDQQQFEVLDRAFGQRDEGALLLVGDPKQSIYGFRGGDVFAYRTARRCAAERYSLSTSYRHTPRLITAINSLFELHPKPFVHDFIDSLALRPSALVAGNALANEADSSAAANRPAVAVHWLQSADGNVLNIGTAETASREAAVAEIERLTATSGDVAVLARSNDQLEKLAVELEARGIDFEMNRRGDVLTHPAAIDLERLLAAWAAPTRRDLRHGAWATRLFGYDAAALMRLIADPTTHERESTAFLAIRDSALQRGPSRALQGLLSKAAPRLVNEVGGDSWLAAFRQLLEGVDADWSRHANAASLLQRVAERRADAYANPKRESNQSARLGSSDARVTLMTLHGAKGLEFDHVLLPFITGGPRVANKGDIGRWHDGAGELQFGPQADDAELAEPLSEECRLLYVGMTRARQTLWMATGEVGARGKNARASALDWLLLSEAERAQLRDAGPGASLPTPRDALQRWVDAADGSVAVRALGDPEADPNAADSAISSPPDLPDRANPAGKGIATTTTGGSVESADQETSFFEPERLAPIIPRPRSHTSFSALFGGSAAGAPELLNAVSNPSTLNDRGSLGDTAESVGPVDSIEQSAIGSPAESVDPRLVRGGGGIALGHAVHAVLERIDFADERTHRREMADQSRRFGLDVDAALAVTAMVQRTVSVPIIGRVALCDLADADQRREVGFVYPLDASLPDLVAALSASAYARAPGAWPPRPRLQGFMHGFIDLVVRVDGRYYVIDYKSNFVGPRREDYAAEGLRDYVRQHDYDLQYLIYCVAMLRWLRLRMGAAFDFDRHFGGVRYLFLRGLDSEGHGIHIDTPPQDLLAALDRWAGKPAPAPRPGIADG